MIDSETILPIMALEHSGGVTQAEMWPWETLFIMMPVEVEELLSDMSVSCLLQKLTSSILMAP